MAIGRRPNLLDQENSRRQSRRFQRVENPGNQARFACVANLVTQRELDGADF